MLKRANTVSAMFMCLCFSKCQKEKYGIRIYDLISGNISHILENRKQRQSLQTLSLNVLVLKYYALFVHADVVLPKT